MRLAEVKEQLEDNLARLQQAPLRKYVPFAEFNQSYPVSPSDYREMSEARNIVAEFNTRLEWLDSMGRIAGESVGDILFFSGCLEQGIRQAESGRDAWRFENHSWLGRKAYQWLDRYKRSVDAQREKNIKDLLAFELYGEAQIALQFHVDEFDLLRREQGIKLLNPGEPIDPNPPHAIPILTSSNIYYVQANLLRRVKQVLGINPDYKELAA